MTPESTESMRNACHALAEHILRMPTTSNRCKWLKGQLADLLRVNDHILWYAGAYEKEYPYADIPNPYLVDLIKAYDEDAYSPELYKPMLDEED